MSSDFVFELTPMLVIATKVAITIALAMVLNSVQKRLIARVIQGIGTGLVIGL